jgi:hypothetical protein
VAKSEPGYDRVVFMAFLDANGTHRDDGTLATLNERRLTESNRATLERWYKRDVIPLHKADGFLTQYDLMLFEREHWCEETFHGWDGFVDQ